MEVCTSKEVHTLICASPPPGYTAPIFAGFFLAKNTLHRLILSLTLSCMMTGASHSSLVRWAIISEIREYRFT